jgi:hypothetical protein
MSNELLLVLISLLTCFAFKAQKEDIEQAFV